MISLPGSKYMITIKVMMMAKFGYTNRRQMDPRPGVKYATEYYRQSATQRARCLQHIERVIQQVGEQALESAGNFDLISEPMTGFPRTKGEPNYSALDVMRDLVDQLDAGKDIPSGMLGRWNRLFAGTGLELELVPQSELPAPTVFNQLFGNS
jgi:hypothetical protein